jgi:phage terminase large subunit-like protein
VFKKKLIYHRSVRDGKIVDPTSLPLIYEYPDSMMGKDKKPWLDPKTWHIPNPSLGYSVDEEWLTTELRKKELEGAAPLSLFVSKHFNVESGLGLKSGSWAGAEFWLGNPKTGASNVDKTLTLDALLRRCEVVVIGIDGGGLDDLLGLAVLGREKGTGRWLLWSHAWAHEIVKQRRSEIATKLDELAGLGQLTFVDLPGQDVEEIAAIVMQVEEAGLLAREAAIGVDSFGVTDIIKVLTRDDHGIAEERIVGIPQGWQLNGAIKTAERNLAGGTLIHSGLELMSYAVGNAKVVPRGNAITIDKQVSGTAKIDPLAALLNCVVLMGKNPQSAPTYQMLFVA